MTTKPTPPQESALKLVYHSSLPEILRLIASELENNRAHAEDFTAKVGSEFFHLSVSLRLK